jgi:hypothetical protein
MVNETGRFLNLVLNTLDKKQCNKSFTFLFLFVTLETKQIFNPFGIVVH